MKTNTVNPTEFIARHVSAGLARRPNSDSRQGRHIAIAFVFLFLSLVSWSQTAPRVARPASRVVVRDVAFHSASLARDMKYRIVLPADYETSGRRYPVLYLLHGLTGHYEDWESRTHLDDYVAGLPLIVAMPEGDDSWYTNSATQPQEKWEDYVVKDFISEIDAKYRTIQTRHARAIAGLSMGGYGAMKFALKYPGTFIFAASFSGALGVTRPEFRRAGPKMVSQVEAIFGPLGSDTNVQNDVFTLAGKVTNPGGLPYLWVSCGTEDTSLIALNQEFASLLVKQQIRHSYSESAGAHTWQYWDEQLPYALSLLMDRYFREPKLPASKAAAAKR